jgi:hypothetical protein
MIEKYFLNTRGQVRLWIIAIAVCLCQLFSLGLHLPEYRIDVVPSIVLISLIFAAAHMLFLGLFNYFFRHPIVRYTLLGVTFELLLVVGLCLLLLLFENNDRFSLNTVFETYWRVHIMWETWYFIITPSIVVVVSAMFIEFKAGQYYCVEVLKKKSDSNILDDIL